MSNPNDPNNPNNNQALSSIAAPATNRRLKRRKTVVRASAEEVEERRSKVFQLRLRGHSYDYIASVMNLSAMTVKRDFDAITEENKDIVATFDKSNFVGETIATIDDVIARAWEDYNATLPGTTQRLKALDMVRLANLDRVRIMNECGVIQKQAEKHEHNVSVEVIQGWDPEVRQRAVEAILQGVLKTPLLEPVKDENVIDAVIIEEEPVKLPEQS